MDYPESILPKANFVTPFPLEELNLPDYSVTRRIEGKLNDNIEVVGGRAHLNPDCLGKIVGMSVNLIGGVFLPEYTPLRQFHRGSESWDGISDINITDFEGCVEDTGYDYVFYRLPILCGAEYPYVYKFKNKDAYKAYQQFLEQTIYPQFDVNRDETISITLSLEHAPTNLNYWHFVMNVELTDNRKRLKNDASWREMIFKHILTTVLCQEFTEKLETEGTIAPDLYMK